MWKAFEGANGWYVAWEKFDGFHGQPENHLEMTEREAKAEARWRNAEENAARGRHRDEF